MSKIRELVAAGLDDGSFRAALIAHAFQWRMNQSSYQVSSVVRYAVEEDLADEVHNILTDEQFRGLRLALHGAPALRNDLQSGMEYFGKNRPDFLRYIRVMSQQRSAERDDAYARLHRRHCQAFGDFLQLDTPAHERRQIGIHKILHSLFPMELSATSDTGPPAEVILRGYQLGTWSCECGARRGHDARYEYACSCCTISGHGRLSPRSRRCRRCGEPASYTNCEQCGKRVTLDLWRRIQRGGVHPSACRIPLELSLSTMRPAHISRPAQFELMQLPLLLGLTERGHDLVFDLPDLMWINELRDRHGLPRPTGHLLAVGDRPRYRRKADITSILELALLRTLTERGQPTGSALEAAVSAEFGYPRLSRKARSADWFSDRFDRIVGKTLTDSDLAAADLSRGADLSRPCTVAILPALNGAAAIIARTLYAPGAVTEPDVIIMSKPLRTGLFAHDELTMHPPGVSPDRCRALGDDGMARIGESVEPGDLLAGISEPVPEDDLPSKERLLAVILGEKGVVRRDASLRWTGNKPAQVVNTHLSTIRATGAKTTGRSTGAPRTRDWAVLNITVATQSTLETGDILRGPDDSYAVVCGFHDDGPADILIGPGHPWASGSNRSVVVRLVPDERAQTVVQARSTGSYSKIKQLPQQGPEQDPGQPLQLEDLVWLLSQGAHRTALELYAVRTDSIDGRLALRHCLADGKNLWTALATALDTGAPALREAPPEAVRNWDRLLRSAGVETVRQGNGLVFRALSDDEVLKGSAGEVLRSSSINMRTGKPEKNGLFCERIFGPTRDNTCYCGKYRDSPHHDVVCNRCGVKVTTSEIRRDRMGHINLAAAVVHPWYQGVLCQSLDLDLVVLTDIIHGRRGVDRQARVVVADDVGGQDDHLSVGAEALAFLLARRTLKPPRGAILRRIAVLPAGVRELSSQDGRWRWAAVNVKYQGLIHHNTRLERLLQLNAPELICRNEQNKLQQAVDDLLGPHVKGSVANLTTILPGRNGSFRQRLFERPVDYSARAPAVSASTGSVDRALFPIRIVRKMLAPLVAGRLVRAGEYSNIETAGQAVEDGSLPAEKQLRLACADLTVLLSMPDSPWPLFAMRAGMTTGQSVELDSSLFEHLGWDRVGDSVRIFPLLAEESGAEARSVLLPSILLQATSSYKVSNPQCTLLDLSPEKLFSEIVQLIEAGESTQLSDLDQFLLFPSVET